MSGNSTIYDVRVRYAIDGDRASGGLRDIARHADKASEGVFSLKHAMEALAIKEVFHLGKEALIDFNSEMDSLRIGLSTVMNMNLHMPIEKANKEADKLFDTFQALAKKSPLTTKDFADMANMIAPAIALAGGGPDKLAKITAGALTAGLAYGQRADIVGLDVTEMMMGNVTKRNRLGNQLLGSIGMEHGEFNKKSASERATLVEKMFSQEGLKKAADRFGETFKGQTSTLKDNLQIALGQVGMPLMQALTGEVKKWNAWIEKHPKLIAETISHIGDMIKDAFAFVQKAAGWLFDNRELFLTLGKTFLVFKGAQLGANVFKKFADGIGNLTENFKTAGTSIVGLFTGAGGGGITGAFSSLTGVLTGVGGVIPALGLFVGGLQIAFDVLNTHSEADKKAKDFHLEMHEAVGEFPALGSRKSFLESSLAGKNPMMGPLSDEMKDRFSTELESVSGKFNDHQKLGEAIKSMGDANKKAGGASFADLSMEGFRHLDRQINMNSFAMGDETGNKQFADDMHTISDRLNKMPMEELLDVLKYVNPDQFGKPDLAAPKAEEPWKNLGPDKSNINVTIQKIEVASEDPDRFVFGLAKIGEQATKHPTQSQHTIPGGF